MLYKNEEAFAKVFKAEGARGLYLFYGSEEYLVDAWRAKIEACFKGSGDFNLQRLNGRSLDLDMLCAAVDTLPMLMGNTRESKKCIVVQDLDPSKLTPSGMGVLEDLLSDIPPDCVVVITGRSAFDMKNANAKKIIKLAQANGTAVELPSRNQAGLAAFLRNRAKESGCVLSLDLAREIIARCGTNMNSLSMEIDKICARAGYGEIRSSHISDVATPLTEARVFDLGKAILAGKAQNAMEILDDLFYLREQPIAILGALIMTYVDMYRARVARNCGASQAVVVEKFGYKGKEFRVRNAFNAKLSLAALRGSLDALYKCDLRMKGTGISSRTLIEETVVKLLALNHD